MQSLTSAHLRSPNANAESDGYDPCTTRPPPTPTPRQDRTEPDAPVVASCTFARIPGFPIPVPEAASSRVRACMLWQRGAHISLTQSHPPPHCCFSPTSLGPRHSEHTHNHFSFKRIIILIRNTAPTPRLHPHSGSTCLFVLGFRIAYKYLLLPLLLCHTALSLRPLRSVFIYIFSCALSTLYSISVSSFPYCSPSSCCIYCKPVCVYVYMYVRATLVKE